MADTSCQSLLWNEYWPTVLSASGGHRRLYAHAPHQKLFTVAAQQIKYALPEAVIMDSVIVSRSLGAFVAGWVIFREGG